MEHIQHYMFVPGKLENLTIIMDIEGTGITELPISVRFWLTNQQEIKAMITYMQSHYKCRLCKLFALNVSTFSYFMWGVVKMFLDPPSRGKINISCDNNEAELKKHIHPSQLLKRYGGECDPPTTYWPPTFPVGTFRENFEESHATVEEFKAELETNPQLIPPPSLAEYAREKWLSKNKKRPIERREYTLQTRVERRDSFNGIIPEKAEVAPVPSLMPEAENNGKKVELEETPDTCSGKNGKAGKTGENFVKCSDGNVNPPSKDKKNPGKASCSCNIL
eukprot:TRINITY_DN1739_c0_g1_i1.p1 TRINITY_DN1739_c0_g1~~TRINITY_DN1739_c0_g1_i1.p1  ORF type:complete len:278 (-),score=33.05 TRINITY_DN1739_c0_g1_i1:204-1037(-)